MAVPNYVRQLMDNPGSFSGSPGFAFARDEALKATQRAGAARGMRGSGNLFAALADRASGMAAQDFGNEYDRRLRTASLDTESDMAGRRLDLEGELGRGGLALNRDRLALDRDSFGATRDLNEGRLALDTTRAGTERDLGFRGLDDARERGWWDYSTNRDRTELMRSDQANRYALDTSRLGLDRYNARTNRGRARSDDFYRGEESQRAWNPLDRG